MPKRPIHYASCHFTSTYPVLGLSYTLKDPSDFAKLQQGILDGVAAYESSHSCQLQCNITHSGTVVTATISRGKPPLGGANIKDLSHALAGYGALTSDDRSALEDIINGVSVLPPAASVTPSATPVAPAPTPATTIAGPAVIPAPLVAPAAKPAFLYNDCKANTNGGHLRLYYEIDGHAGSHTTNTHYQDMSKAIDTAIGQLPRRSDGSRIKAFPKSPRVNSNTQPVSSVVQVTFSRAHGTAAQQLSDAEMIETLNKLESEGCLNPQHAQNFRAQLQPAAPAPATTITGPAVIPAPAAPAATASQWYHSCQPRIQSTNQMELKYMIQASSAVGVNTNFVALKSLIENAVLQIPSRQNGAHLEVSVGYPSMVGNGAGQFEGRFEVKFSRKLVSLSQPLQAADIQDIGNALLKVGALTPADKQQILQQLITASSQPGWQSTYP